MLPTAISETTLDLDALLSTGNDPPVQEWKIGDVALSLGNLATALVNPPNPPEVILHGVLRRGHKMMVTGPSKAGKTWLMIELACAIATGEPWFGLIPVKRGKVLYLNMELSEGSFINRFKNVTQALKVSATDQANIDFLNLRGVNLRFYDLAFTIAEMVSVKNYSMVIIDPIYKLFEGSENEQQAVADFCSNLDVIANAGASVVYTHHHSKGAQANRAAIDRGSGSGVFGRDADALMDLLEVDCRNYGPPLEELLNAVPDSKPLIKLSKTASAYRVEWTLREFAPRPVAGVWFDCPLHRHDNTGAVANARPKSGQRQGGATSGEQTTKEHQKRLERFITHFFNGTTSVKEMASMLSVSPKTIRNYAKELEYQIKGDLILGPTGNGKQLEISS